MSGFDDHVGIFGDWVPPSPSPRAFVSSLLVDDVGGWLPHMEQTNEHRNFIVEPQEHVTWCSSAEKDGARAGAATDQTVNLRAPSEQKTSSRGGLMERMVARAGFNPPRLNTDGIRPPVLSQNQEVKSPCLVIPAGLSPSVLLYSPVLIYNSLVYPSPTTGLLPIASGEESKNVMSTTAAEDKRKETAFGGYPIMETGKVNPLGLSQQLLPQIAVSVHPNSSLEPHTMEATQNEQVSHETSNFPLLSTEEDVRGSGIKPQARTFNVVGGSMEHSPSLHEQQFRNTAQRGGEESKYVDASTEDGYNWRKYGQNQVKGSEYPRSYYKCTHPNCPVKKKIGRYSEGHVTEIIYRGAHNHPKPLPNQSSAPASSNSFGDMQLDYMVPSGTSVNSELASATIQQGPTVGGLDWRNNNLEVTSFAALHSEYCSGSATLHSNGSQQGSADAVGISSTFSRNEDEHDCGTYGSVSLGYGAGGDESESKRRKNKPNATDRSAPLKAIREPKIVVQTTSEIDLLDDGYRWRKYGQKVVKGNPNPRSYYKCTSPGCNVRKHVERSPHDQKSVITTYEGKHNHDVPEPRNSIQVSSGVPISPSNPITADAQSHEGSRPEPTQLQNSSSERYGRSPSLCSFGSTSGSNSFGTNLQQGLSDIATAEFNSDQHQFSVPVHPYIGCPQPVNDAAFMLSEGEPIPDPNLNYSNDSSTYQQIINGLPPGHQM
ncbi:unnamed protein product [Withania somnifera]